MWAAVLSLFFYASLYVPLPRYYVAVPSVTRRPNCYAKLSLAKDAMFASSWCLHFCHAITASKLITMIETPPRKLLWLFSKKWLTIARHINAIDWGSCKCKLHLICKANNASSPFVWRSLLTMLIGWRIYTRSHCAVPHYSNKTLIWCLRWQMIGCYI